MNVRTLALSLILVSLSACSTSYATTVLRAGTTVHSFRRQYANTHVVEQGGKAFMFDSGLEVDAPSLAADMRRVGINPESLGAIILSHGHADHAGGADYFRRNFGVSIVAGAGDREMLAAGHNDRLCPTNADARSRLQTDQTATYAPYAANTVVEGEQDLKPLTGISGRILAVPGHTAGSVVVILPEAGAALVGDLFRGGVIGSAAELHFYMCDLDGNRRAIRALVDEQAPTVDTFFVGHFGPVSRASVTARFLSFQ